METIEKTEIDVGYRYHDAKGEHLHTYNNVPLIGTTTAINEIYPPPLVWWGSGKALEKLGWLNPKTNDELAVKRAAKEGFERLKAITEPDAYLDLLDECYRNHDATKREAAKKGVDAHALIEEYIQNCLEFDGLPSMADVNEAITKFAAWAMNNVERFLWSEAHVYSTKLGLGGICDFGYVHKSGHIIIADNKPSIYPKNFIQCALYGLQAKENGLVDAEGMTLLTLSQVDGYMIFDYKTGKVKYRTDIKRLEAIGQMTIDLYKHKEVVGTETLEVQQDIAGS